MTIGSRGSVEQSGVSNAHSVFAPSELERIARVWHEALGAVPSPKPPPSTDALLRRITGDLARCHIAVARHGPEIVGFVAYDTDRCWLRQLFVHPESQGLGIGTRLLATAMRAMPDGWLRADETTSAPGASTSAGGSGCAGSVRIRQRARLWSSLSGLAPMSAVERRTQAT